MTLFTTLSQFYIMQMIDKLWGIFCENIVKMLRLVICRQIIDNMWAIYRCLPTKCPLFEGNDHLHGDLRKNRFPPKRVDNSQLSLKRGLQSWFFNSQLLNRYNSRNTKIKVLNEQNKVHEGHSNNLKHAGEKERGGITESKLAKLAALAHGCVVHRKLFPKMSQNTLGLRRLLDTVNRIGISSTVTFERGFVVNE